MRRSLSVLALAAALVLPAGAAAKTTKHFTGTAYARAIQGSTIAGYTVGTLGPGATVYKTKPGPNNTTLVTFTIFEAKGTLSGTSTVTQTAGAEGQPTTLTGDAKITKGTGLYKGAKGSFDVTGTIAPDGLLTLKVTNGTVTY